MFKTKSEFNPGNKDPVIELYLSSLRRKTYESWGSKRQIQQSD